MTCSRCSKRSSEYTWYAESQDKDNMCISVSLEELTKEAAHEIDPPQQSSVHDANDKPSFLSTTSREGKAENKIHC